MKFLHISDLHFGKQLFEYSLIEDQRYWCGQVLDFLKADKHDAVVIAGDLYDRSVPSAEAVELMDGFLSAIAGELKIPVLAVSGNHDSGRRLSFGSSLYRGGGLHMASVPKAEIERVTLTDSFGKVDFWLLPYITPADAKNLFPKREIDSWNSAHQAFIEENHLRIDPSHRNVLVAHGFFSLLSGDGEAKSVTSDSEVVIGGLDITDAAIFSGFDYCAFGHLHAPQRVGGEKMRYSGSPLCYSVSEEHQTKALLSVTVGGHGEITAVKTELVPLHRLYSVSGTLEELSAATGGGFVSGDYVFVNIVTEGTELAAAERVRSLYPSYLGIRYRSRVEQELLLGGGEVMRRRSLPDTFADFFLGVTGRELSTEERSLTEAAAVTAAGSGEAEE